MTYSERRISEIELPELLKKADGQEITDISGFSERRKEILSAFAERIYGFSPTEYPVSYDMTGFDSSAIGGKAEYSSQSIRVKTPDGFFTFPIYQFIPKGVQNPPLVIYLGSRPDSPIKFFPIEEIIDRGCAIITCFHSDISPDINDFHDGLSTFFSRRKYTWGKIALWAWGLSRIVDYAQTLSGVDISRIALAGHTRLGRAALWCAANDERVGYVFANSCGRFGSSLMRSANDDEYHQLVRTHPHWFAHTLSRNIGDIKDFPYDQHMLLACIAPRKICIGGSTSDTRSTPEAAYLSCVAAGEAYKLYGSRGFVFEDRETVPGDCFFDGDIGYFLREGERFFGRFEWNKYIDFLQTH